MVWVEKKIETAIVNYLNWLWAVTEQNNSWKVLVKKAWYNHMMTLQSKWCPDIVCLYKWKYIWIEVKKNKKEVEHWIKQRERYDKGEKIPKSYEREKDQIEYMYKILENKGHFILTYELDEVKEFINNLKLWKK